MQSTPRAFAILELLIAAAIVAVLAVAGLANYEKAQLRSRVSSAESDLRRLSVAIESYAADYGVPPPEAGESLFPPLTIQGQPGQTQILTPAITTPIAYAETIFFWDPFVLNDRSVRPNLRLFTYHAYPWNWPYAIPPRPDSASWGFQNEGPSMTGTVFRDLYGHWRLISSGPDQSYYNKPYPALPASVGLPYDPTNGTLSLGNILRSQQHTRQARWLPVAGQ